jgi:4-hydroxy 2-oxovalerate aldolase
MREIKLLDCTLRDGGYVNDWKFGHNNIVSIFERLVDSNVDVIEIGFLDERRPFDFDRSIMPDTDSVGKIYGTLDRKQADIVGMIDYGTCSIENIKPCCESYLDGIRVIFKKHIMHEAMDFCRQVKELGYKVYSQLVSITSYNDNELMELIDLVNDVKPYAVSMVDTYGLLHPEDMLHYYRLLDKYVDNQVKIGFHAHNNFQLGYANALAFIGEETQRDIVVDGTLYGMGKSAGNAPLELLAMRLNDKFNKHYRIDSMLEGIEESVMSFYEQSPWGYKMFFYLCAKNKCHPNYVTYFMDKHNLSISKIDDLLKLIEPEEKKLLYDKLVAERIYNKYLNTKGLDEEDKIKFAKEIGNKPLLLIGPGKNIELQREKVGGYIKEYNPYIVSVNYIPKEIKVDCVFVTNSKRYHNLTLSTEKILSTSNVECRNGHFDFTVNREPLLERNEKIMDNSFLMLIKLLDIIGTHKITCAGFDGYSEKEDNYFDPTMEYYFVKNEAKHLNSHMKDAIYEFRRTMDIQFLTYSAYDVMEDVNSATF